MSNQFIDFGEGYFYDQTVRDLIDMVKDDMPKTMFTSSCEAMLGDDWKLKGQEILKMSAPDLLQRFSDLTK